MTDHQFDALMASLPAILAAFAAMVASIIAAWKASTTKAKVEQAATVSSAQNMVIQKTVELGTEKNSAENKAIMEKVDDVHAVVSDAVPKPPQSDSR